MNHSGALLEVSGITKQFPGVLALNQVNLHLMPGEVLSVIGENGAGKSTLMKILAGVQKPDTGTIYINEEPVEITSCRHAISMGIALIHQELNLSDNLSIGANIFLGREPLRRGLIDRPKIKSGAQEVLKKVGLDVDPDTLVRELSIGKQQLVEIAKALSANARVLIMDEPTSSLSTSETERLFEVVDELRQGGVSVIYISHRLGEVKHLSDRVEVLRDGVNAGHLSVDDISHDAMVRLMVGRDVSQYYNRSSHPIGDTVLKVDNLVTSTWPGQQLSFDVRAGEIVGIAGLVGAGRTELLQVLFGVEPALEGTIQIEGKDVSLQSPQDAINAGVALVPEGRKEQGLIIDMSVRENVSLAGLWKNRKGAGRLNREKEIQDTKSMIGQLGIKTSSNEQVARFLSGGNQQKVVLGKWLTMTPTILLLDEPTRGIDVGAKQEVYNLMEELAKEGMAVLFVSSELEEILGMSDRTLVMHEGAITGELRREELSEEAVMRLATGSRNAA